MKYIIEKSNKVPGPGGKEIFFGTDPRQSSQEEFNQVIDELLATGKDSEERKKELKEKAWNYLHSGKNLTIDDKILYIKP